MNDVRLDLQQVPARAELRARGDTAAGRGEPKPRGGASQSVCQSHPLRRSARRGGVAHQRAGRACRLQEAPLACRTAALAPQRRARPRCPKRSCWRSCRQRRDTQRPAPGAASQVTQPPEPPARLLRKAYQAMFGLRPSAPTRPDDYAVRRAGRPLRNTRVRPRGLIPRRLAQLADADPRRVQHVTPDPWVPEPALALSDVIAGPKPWTGMLLDPSRPQPVPIGSLIRSIAPARHWLVWPDARLRPAQGLAGTDPRSVAAYLDEPAMAHFARELDEAAAEATMAEQGDGPLDVHVIECAIAGGYGGDAAAADAVTAWIAETLRRGIPMGNRSAGIPRACGRRSWGQHPQRRPVCRWL